MYPIATALLLLFAFAFFAYTIYHRIKLAGISGWHQLRLDQIGTRIQRTLSFAFGQRRFFLHDVISGTLHAFIFWGFLVVLIRTIVWLGKGIYAPFEFPGLGDNPLGHFYIFTKDLFEVFVVVAVLGMLLRRLIFRPRRLSRSAEGYIILATIMAIMLSDFVMDGIVILSESAWDNSFNWMGIFTARVMADSRFASGTLNSLFTLSYFVHIGCILGFLNFLPYGKHFHIITGIPNVFLQRLTPYGALDTLDLEDESATEFGTGKIEGLGWKQVVDLYSCTECGRCQAVCPAYDADKPLNPKALAVDLRDHLYARAPEKTRFASWLSPSHPDYTYIEAGDKKPEKEKKLIGEVINPDTLWSCTTCRACEEACPVFIEYVDKIVDMRRHLVLMEGAISTEGQTALRNIENQGNPWGLSAGDRAMWLKELGVPILADGAHVDYLYWVGCAGAYDDRAKQVTKALVKCLQTAGVSFGILGNEESCTGDAARRLGNEYLFQIQARQNIEKLNKYRTQKIITTCPHCFNTLKNEYPQFGGNYEVIHHSEFLHELIRAGKLPLRDGAPEKITFHDSCYLGRYNDIYAAPRQVLAALPGARLVEPKLSKDVGRCCGAGGGLMWLEDRVGQKVNQMRFADLDATGATTFASACPFCLTMLRDATNDKGASERVAVKDIAEICADYLRTN